MNRLLRNTGTGACMALATAGCYDLSVNTTFDELTREAIIADPVLIETVLAGTGVNLWAAMQNVANPWAAMEVMGERVTSSSDAGLMWATGQEPRVPLENQTGTTAINSTPWALFYEANSSAAEMQRVIRDEDVRLIDPLTNNDNTTRGLAWAKFVQGASHAYLSILYDRAAIVNIDVDLSEVPTLPLAEYTEVRDSALKWLNEAATLAENNTFTFPYTNALWFWNTSLSNTAFAQIVHSVIARVMVYSTRTPDERAALPWGDANTPGTVLYHLERSIRTDFGPGGDGTRPNALLTYQYKQMAFAHAVSAGDREFEGASRADLRLLGPADTTRVDTDNPPDGIVDRYQYEQWLTQVGTPEGRNTTVGFIINTPDKRISPSTSVNTDPGGKPIFFMFTTTPITQSLPGAGTPIQPEDRGLYYRESNYFSQSLTDGQLNAQGQMSDIPDIGIRVVEMDLLKAEAHYRLGNLAEVVALVNKSRELNGELPPVDVNGPPQADSAQRANCVPRRYDGTCGDLWDALIYEKRIETYGSHGLIPWADGRGWGCLLPGTLTELPIPARQLDLMNEPLYTFGGRPGERGSAPATVNCPLLFIPS